MSRLILAAAVLAASAGTAFASGGGARNFAHNTENDAICATRDVQNLSTGRAEAYRDETKHVWLWNFKNPLEATVHNIHTGKEYSFNLNKGASPVYSGNNKVTYSVTGTMKGVHTVSFEFPKNGAMPSDNGYTITAGVMTVTSQDKILTADCLFKGR